jgi:hypothetical protein
MPFTTKPEIKSLKSKAGSKATAISVTHLEPRRLNVKLTPAMTFSIVAPDELRTL